MRTRRAFPTKLAVAALVLAGGLAGEAPAPAAAAAPTPGMITSWAGGVGDGPAVNMSVRPEQLATSGALVFITDSGHEAIRVLDTRTGELRTVAGNGDTQGWVSAKPRGDGGPATASRLGRATGVAVDASGRVYLADYEDSRVRRVDGSGVITTFAGGGNPPDGRGDGGPATRAGIAPYDLAMDAQGNLLANEGLSVRKISPSNVISTVSWTACPCDGPAAPFRVSAIAVDPTGHLYLATYGKVLKVDDAGVLRLVAGGGSPADGVGDGGQATDARLVEPMALAFDPAGNLFVADQATNRIRRVAPSGSITTVAGGGSPADGMGDGGPATASALSAPSGVVVGADGALYVSDTGHHRLRKVSGGVITTVAGGVRGRTGGDGGPAAKAQFSNPAGLARDAAGNTYVADHEANRVRRIDQSGRVSTFAGTGDRGFSGDGGAATAARLESPTALAVDGRGNVFVTDKGNGRVRRIDAGGTITTVAGGGSDPLGDGGPATSALLQEPSGLAVDAAGNVFVAERGNRRVRKMNTAGTISTFAGGGTGRSEGNGVPATSVAFSVTASLAFDPLGQLHIATGAVVWKVDLAGMITTVLGGPGAIHLGPSSFSQKATSVMANDVGGIAFDANGDLFFVAGYDNRIIRIDAMGRVRAVAGTGDSYTNLGDGGQALAARIDVEEYSGLAVDGAGNLYVADTVNHRIRRIDLVTTPRRVFATGWNAQGQLGDGSTTDRRAVTVAVGLEHVRSVAAGYYHSLALRADGTVWSWGWNGYGQLGDGTTTDRRTPTRVAGVRDVVAVAAGVYHSLALRADGSVWSWGWNGVGQLGDGTVTDRTTPVRVTGLTGVKAFSAGGFHSLALTLDGGVWSWGWNHFGQLGTGSAADIGSSPVRIPGSSGATSIAAGALHSLASGLTEGDGTVWSWGWNAVGQLGDGTTVDRRTPARIAAWGDVWAGGYHSFSGSTGSWFQGWGWNLLGQLGTPTPDGAVVTPIYMVLPRQGNELAPGLVHSASVGIDGSVASWGWNPTGALGDGTLDTRTKPAVVPGATVQRVSAGALHTLFVG